MLTGPCRLKDPAVEATLRAAYVAEAEEAARARAPPPPPEPEPLRLRQSLTFDVSAMHTDGSRRPDALPVTAACLDLKGRRLVTGAHDGSLWVSHFNSGAALLNVGAQHTARKAGLRAAASAAAGRAEVSSCRWASWNPAAGDGRDDVLFTTGWQVVAPSSSSPSPSFHHHHRHCHHLPSHPIPS